MTASAVYLLRHGRTAPNASGTWQGQADVHLDDVGRHEARLAGKALSGIAPARLVSSDLARAAETARALGDVVGMEPELDPRLREVSAGSWEGLTRAEIEERDPEALAAWKAGEDVRIGGGERISEAGARFAGALLEHAADTDGVLVLVGHGGAIGSAVRQLCDLPPQGRVLGRLRNAHWAVLVPPSTEGPDASAGPWTLDTWNAGPDGL
jgi:probable phosphoglycerate mutase